MKKYQILLITHHCDAFKNESEVQLIVDETGFGSNHIVNDGKASMPLKNLYGGYFEGVSAEQIILELKEKIYASCKKHGFGVLDFFLIDATDSTMFKGHWHDGYY